MMMTLVDHSSLIELAGWTDYRGFCSRVMIGACEEAACSQGVVYFVCVWGI